MISHTNHEIKQILPRNLFFNDFFKYFLIGILFWIVVDYTTVFNPNFQDWLNHMPLICVFYIGYPLLFAYLIYTRKWDAKKIFYSMLIVAFIIEVILSKNALLYTFPIMLIMIPAAICIYGFLTFIPKWIIEKNLKENKKKLILFTVVWIIVSVLNFFTKTNLNIS